MAKVKKTKKSMKKNEKSNKKPSLKALQDFEIYGKGVRRLVQLKKELDALDTRKFKSQERAIRRKLNSVHLIPEIEYDLRDLKKDIAGLDKGYEKSKIDVKQSKKIRALEKKATSFDIGGKVGRRLVEEEKDIIELRKKIASLKTKISMPAKKRIFVEVKELSEKIDKNKEELYNKMVDEISESKWMIEREKQELRDELNDIISESRWLIEKEAQEINEQLLTEMKTINEKIEEDKAELYENLLSKFTQVKSQVEKLQSERESMKKELESYAKEKEKQLEEKEKKISQGLPQPFVPPQRFSEVKVRELPPNLKILKGKKLKKAKETDAFEFKKHDKSVLPELPDLEEDLSSTLPESFKFPRIDSKKISRLPVSRIALPTQGTKIYTHEHHLPEIPEQEFVHDLKQAMNHEKLQQKADEIEKAEDQIQEKLKKEKKAIFVEVNDFRKTEKDLEGIKLRSKLLESGVKSSVKEKDKEHNQVAALVDETEQIGILLAAVNKKILSQIKSI